MILFLLQRIFLGLYLNQSYRKVILGQLVVKLVANRIAVKWRWVAGVGDNQ
jgi:hypothetical protein